MAKVLWYISFVEIWKFENYLTNLCQSGQGIMVPAQYWSILKGSLFKCLKNSIEDFFFNFLVFIRVILKVMDIHLQKSRLGVKLRKPSILVIN
jgi:hypothetical protein